MVATTVWHAVAGTPPSAGTMGVVGMLALAANPGAALMLYRSRGGGANMRLVWMWTRIGAVCNVAVVPAALGVFGTGTGWPDVIVASVMAALGISGGWQIVRQSLAELRAKPRRLVAAE